MLSCFAAASTQLDKVDGPGRSGVLPRGIDLDLAGKVGVHAHVLACDGHHRRGDNIHHPPRYPGRHPAVVETARDDVSDLCSHGKVNTLLRPPNDDPQPQGAANDGTRAERWSDQCQLWSVFAKSTTGQTAGSKRCEPSRGRTHPKPELSRNAGMICHDSSACESM